MAADQKHHPDGSIEKICRSCQEIFVIEPDERAWFDQRAAAEPDRVWRHPRHCRSCRSCRAERRQQAMVSR